MLLKSKHGILYDRNVGIMYLLMTCVYNNYQVKTWFVCIERLLCRVGTDCFLLGIHFSLNLQSEGFGFCLCEKLRERGYKTKIGSSVWQVIFISKGHIVSCYRLHLFLNYFTLKFGDKLES